jgi:DNA-binding LytR/AlgR family response regulator
LQGTVPTVSRPDGTRSTGAPERDRLGAVLRILILEDDLLTAFDLQCIVEDSGHEIVDVCGTISDARRHLASPLDFAFLDIDLPDGKSFELATRLGEMDVPFVFVSASMRCDVPAHLRHARFIAKPYHHAAIRSSLGNPQSLAC